MRELKLPRSRVVPPSATIDELKVPETLPRSTYRYSSLAVQSPPITPSTPPPTVHPGLMMFDLVAPARVALESTCPYARPPVAYNSTVGATRTPARPRTVPNQSSCWLIVTGTAGPGKTARTP